MKIARGARPRTAMTSAAHDAHRRTTAPSKRRKAAAFLSASARQWWCTAGRPPCFRLRGQRAHMAANDQPPRATSGRRPASSGRSTAQQFARAVVSDRPSNAQRLAQDSRLSRGHQARHRAAARAQSRADEGAAAHGGDPSLGSDTTVGNRGGSGSRLSARQRKNKNWAGDDQYNSKSNTTIGCFVDYLAGNSCLAPTGITRTPALHELLDQLGSPLLNQLVRPLTVIALDYLANLPLLIQLGRPLTVPAWMSSAELARASPQCTTLDVLDLH
ncbi:Nbs-lrr resistance protein [Dorcoceras hygrometricum]|uniref:Nbs-lrr resistance protein n=1 Tax=Dorcoceras hygrometricum TaxID=472368 RepID=A0A2Z7B2R0_9LAMI|nr:Nbs-lrr resistance protein [Dorcoceras hygrometricum]